MSTCPACFEETPPFLFCGCPKPIKPVCTQCHNKLGHPGAPCPDCPNSQGFFVIGRRPNGQTINAICATCDGHRRLP